MPIQEIRRANLQRLVDVSSVSDVAKRSGRPISQICDVLYARKAFGEKLARRLENELELHAIAQRISHRSKSADQFFTASHNCLNEGLHGLFSSLREDTAQRSKLART